MARDIYIDKSSVFICLWYEKIESKMISKIKLVLKELKLDFAIPCSPYFVEAFKTKKSMEPVWLLNLLTKLITSFRTG